MPDEYEELLDTAMLAAREGSEVVRRHFRAASLDVRRKGENDYVTLADRESEAAIVSAIARRHPSHRILAEEGGGTGAGGDSEYQWLIDPLDGTTNFLQGLPVYCVSVACRRGEEPIAGVISDPEGGNVWSAVRGGGALWNGRPMAVSRRQSLRGAFLATGYPFRAHSTLDAYLAIFREAFLQAKAIRRCGAAALDLAYTAAGVYDGFFEFRLSPWDIGAGILLVREAGGVVTDLDGGDRFFAGGNIVAGSKAVHRDLLVVVRRHTSEADLDRMNPMRPLQAEV
jgi:myo-inositol-1(or 4)-monophosphatase